MPIKKSFLNLFFTFTVPHSTGVFPSYLMTPSLGFSKLEFVRTVLFDSTKIHIDTKFE